MAQFDYAGAKASGYSDAEIAQFLAQQQKFDLAGALNSGYSEQEVVSFLTAQPPEQSVFREVADVPLALTKGLVQGARMGSDVLGAGSGVSQALRSAEDYISQLMSAQSKQDSAEMARIMAEAEDKGLLEQVKAGFKAFSVAPIDLLVQGVGTTAPAIAAALLAPEGLLASAAVLGIGALQGTGAVKGSIYDSVYTELLKTGVPENQAKQAATEAQSYGGENLDQILMGTALGAIASRTGIEPAVLRGATLRALGKTGAGAIGKEVAEAEARELAKKAATSIPRQALVSGATEAGTEAAQGGQEQLAANIAAQRAGIDVPTTRGVAAAATLEGTLGALLGGPAGAIEVSSARNVQAKIDEAAKALQESVGTGNADSDLADIADELGDPELAKEYRLRAGQAPTAPPKSEADQKEMTDEQVAEALKKAGEAGEAEAAVSTGTPPTKITEPEVEATAPEVETTGATAPAEITAPTGVTEPEVEATAPEAANFAVNADEAAAVDAEQTNIQAAAVNDVAATVQLTPEGKVKRGRGRPRKVAASIDNVTETALVSSEPVDKKKRGRPATQLTPEQQEQKEAQRKQDVSERVNRQRDAERALSVINITPNQWEQAAGGVPGAGEAAAAVSRVDALTEAYRVLATDKKARTKAGQAAKQATEHSSVTPAERTRAQAALKAKAGPSRSTRLPIRANPKPNPVLATMRKAGDAIARLTGSGNKFERALAARLRPFLKNVDIVVVTDPSTLPPEVASEFTGDNAAEGLYTQSESGKRIIYLNGTQDRYAVDNMTFLHEAVHAATVDIITAFLENPSSLNTMQYEIVNDLQGLMAKAATVVAARIQNNTATPAEVAFSNSDAFADLREFVSYGMTHPAMQKILLNIDAPLKLASSSNPSLLSSFVNKILKLFGLGGDNASAFSDLIVLVDDVLTAVDANVPYAITVTAARRVTSQQKTQVKLDKSTKATDASSVIDTMINSSRKLDTALDFVASTFDVMTTKALQAVLYAAFDTADITRLLKRLSSTTPRAQPTLIDSITPHIANVSKRVEDMNAWRNKFMRRLSESVTDHGKWQAKNQQAARTLANTAFAATLLGADPTLHPDIATALVNDDQIKDLNTKLANSNLSKGQKAAIKGQITKRSNDLKLVYKLKDKLQLEGGAKGVDLFRRIRDDYVYMLDENIATLKQMVAASTMKAAGKSRLLAKINSDYAEAKRLGVYFPLVRYGNHWLRLGKGKDSEFYMFESAIARDVYARQLARNNNMTLEDMMQNKDMDMGDDVQSLRKADVTGTTGQMLKDVFALIDKGGIQDVEALKDSIYQLYLYTLPDQSARRRFVRRKGRTGFSTDFLRNYITTQTSNINQMARLKYRSSIELALSSAQKILDDSRSPSKPKLNAIVNEVSQRVKLEFNPPSPDDFLNNAATLGNKAVFYYMMTSLKSAIVQFTQLPNVGFPVLATKYGWGKTSAVAGRYMNLFNKLSTTRTTETGEVVTEWGAPSIQNSTYITENKDPVRGRLLAEAWEYLNNRGVFMETYAGDMSARGKEASLDADKLFTLRTVGNFMAGAFHHSERIAREIMGMSSFELAYDAAIARGMTPADAKVSALQEAETLTYEGMFNYSQFNKPRLFRAPGARLFTQFLSYGLQMTSFLLRNAINMIPMSGNTNKAQALELILGVLGMTALFAGVTGLPLYSAIMGTADAYRELMRKKFKDDPEFAAQYDAASPDNPFGGLSMDLWFRGQFLPKYFGPNSSLANAFGLSESQAETLQRAAEFGPISAFTNLNFSASTALDGLWFRDERPSETSRAAFESMMLKMSGPFGSMIGNMGDALDFFENGDIQRGLERLLPAFFRGATTSYRLEQEGLMTKEGNPILDQQFYDASKFLFRSLGFTSTEEAQIQEARTLAMQLSIKLESERNKLLDRANRAVRKLEVNPHDEKAIAEYDATLQDMIAFSNKAPFMAIDGGTLISSLSNRTKARISSEPVLGLRLTDGTAAAILPMIQYAVQTKEK